MPINKSNIIFIGNAGGRCGYLSHGINIIRKSSSLTTKRVAEEPEFEGFRKSGNRMKQASPIAASLYNLLTREQKEYALYRTLTGEVLKMIKKGMEVEMIVGKLKEQYIDPILKAYSESKNRSEEDKTNTLQLKEPRYSCRLSEELFKIPNYSRGDKRHRKVKRILQYSDAGSNQLILAEEQNSEEDNVRNKETVNITSQTLALTPKQKRVAQFSPYIYMGRLKECKGLKMWHRFVF